MSITVLSVPRIVDCSTSLSERRSDVNLFSSAHYHELKQRCIPELESTYLANSYCSPIITQQTYPSLPAAKGLKPILKKSRSSQSTRIPRFTPMPQFVNANHHFKCSYQNPLNQSGSQISLENPHLKIKDITITKQSPPSRIHSYNTQTRPLPTPPVTKHIRWATYHEVLEIDNIEDLALQGYYDDYDGELGWNYRDETKEAHVSLDTNDKGESAGNKERRDTRFTHGNSCFSSPSSLLFENESETESDSVTDDSEIAEDEAIQQIAEMGNLYSSISSLPPLPSFNSQQQHQVPSSQKPQITYETLPKVDDHTYYDDTPVVSSLLLREPSPKIVEMTSPKHPLPLPLTGYYLSLAATAPFTKYHTISNNRLATLMKPVSLRVECVLKGRAPRLDRDRILAEVAKRRSINAVTA